MKQYEFDQYRSKALAPEKIDELENSLRRVLSTVEGDSTTLQSLEKQQRELDFEIDRIKDNMTKKVDYAMYKRIEDKFNHYTPINKFLTLDNNMHYYASKEQAEEIENNLKDLSEKVDLKAQNEDVNQKFSDFKTDFGQITSTLATKEDMEYDFKRQDAKLEKNIKKVRDEIKVLKELEGRITTFAQKLNNYPTISKMNNKLKEVWKNFDTCCSYDHILDFKAEMNPRMNQ